jgi:hypothetical protein
MYFTTSLSLLISFIPFSPCPPPVSSSLNSSLCIFFSLLGIYFCRFWCSFILSTPLLLPSSIIHILCPTTQFSFLSFLLPWLLFHFLSLLFQLHTSFSSTVISSKSCSSNLFLVSSYTLLLLVYPIFLLSAPPLFFLNSFISAWNRQKK